MEIKDEAQTVDILFSGSRREYKIPIYQRRYVWNEKNWSNLWTDIEQRPPNGLFTGIIVTRQQDSPGDLETYDVIDGQQRLTTFQIILCVIRDICRSIGYIAKGDEADLLIQIEDRHKLHLKEGSDANAFRTLVDSGTRDDHIIHQAYEYFKNLMEGYSQSEIDNIYAAITRGINVAQINLIEGDVSEKIFASLNATGRMLNEFDYLRNDLFLRAGRRGIEFYNSVSHWDPSFEEDKPSNLDAFLRDFLKANLGPNCFDSDVKPFELYQQDYRVLLTHGIEDEFKQLSAYAQFREEINDPSTKIGSHVQFYKDLNLPRLDSFILFAKQKLTSVSELLEFCKILESYIVQRMLCDGGYIDAFDKINAVFAEYVRKDGGFTASELKKSLLDTWPNDGKIQVSLQNAGLQSIINANLILYILYRIESRTRTLHFGDLVDLVPKHVMPSKHVDSWDRSDWEDAKFSDAIDNIGNIALIPTALSTDWSRLSFAEKKRILASPGIGHFNLNKAICGFPHWRLTQIEDTTDKLLLAFRRTWSR